MQFGFAPMSLYDAIARNALQLGPEGPDLGKVILWVLALLAVLFLVIEVSAIFVGLVLARSITGSVHALSQGTEHVRQGDFGYKVQVRSRDQLGELADSFNLMTSSIQDLLTQSAEKERLEEELRIARTIQMSLPAQGSGQHTRPLHRGALSAGERGRGRLLRFHSPERWTPRDPDRRCFG